MTHRASSLKRPCVGDVVAQIVDLELEHKFTIYILPSILTATATKYKVLQPSAGELHQAQGQNGLIGQYLSGSIPMDDDRQSIIQQIPGSYPSIFKL